MRSNFLPHKNNIAEAHSSNIFVPHVVPHAVPFTPEWWSRLLHDDGLKLALVRLQAVAEVVSTHEVELAAIVDRRCRILMYWHSTCVRRRAWKMYKNISEIRGPLWIGWCLGVRLYPMMPHETHAHVSYIASD